jgi:transposase
MKRIMTQLLNLTEIIVESSIQEGSTLILSVSKKEKSARKPTLWHLIQKSASKSKLFS